MKVDIYFNEHKDAWDNFVRDSKNGTFLFYRDFMDYHSHRFNDLSMLFYKDSKLIALLPANLDKTIFYSHQGLTYGGLIMSKDTTMENVLEIFEYLTTSLRLQGIKEIIYKPIPHIYHQTPAEEDLYALFINSAQLVGRGISSSILLPSNQQDYSKSRLRGLKKADEANLYIQKTDDLSDFWDILSENLLKKYNSKPTHSLEEIELLRSRFPNNIKLYAVYNSNNELVGGELVFETPNVMHAQYTAATNEGLDSGAIDFVIDHIIRKSNEDKVYFDYGISTENNGLYLNKGLIAQKEGFGARAIMYDIYSIKLS